MPARWAAIAAAGVLIAAAPWAGARSVSAGAASAPGGGQRFVIVPGESKVLYRVGEVFLNQNNRFNVAEGVTTAVRGEIVIDRAVPRNSRVGPITVDISQFRSDSARRDNAIRERWLESARFPLATFTPTVTEGLPATYADGQELRLAITGDLKIRETTRRVTFDTVLKLEGTTLVGLATAQIRMTDFGFDPPAIFGILRAENDVRLEFHIVARAAQ
ncbi:MAG: YceI family protein [Armatimonadota bacterium]|nr:YceI family protein [Armatimonadota bacterium]MDR7485905.1 YceI family protein [Armatimonadota bacterium]MDR7533144.1 YceI family protein [Armatimonadota bacterium]MDR7536610.1 YceI family protein [Armatimonadota bacterium]